jgi:hypothetical protein
MRVHVWVVCSQVGGLFADWFMTGARLDLKELPQQHDPSRTGFSDSAFTDYARTHGVLHTAGGVDYFAWNNQVGDCSPLQCRLWSPPSHALPNVRVLPIE